MYQRRDLQAFVFEPPCQTHKANFLLSLWTRRTAMGSSRAQHGTEYARIGSTFLGNQAKKFVSLESGATGMTLYNFLIFLF